MRQSTQGSPIHGSRILRNARAFAHALSLVLATVLSTFPTAAQGGLDETCVVTMLNRTASVRPDGSWRLDNVPANLGPVRARVTCLRDGATLSGETPFRELEPEIVNGFDEIFLGSAEPRAESLLLSAPRTTLSEPGATLEIGASARFADGTTEDLDGDPGLTFTSSNPAIASVDTGGRVTAVSSGAVLVSATRDGLLGVVRLRIVLGGDRDGDGIPDDVELELGLDPNDPIDGLEDLDTDGLPNAQEIALGTDPRDADSDGDGLLDGEEATPGTDGFLTDPLLFDSDGDGLSDGLEAAAGTDPTDPASFDLASALERLEVEPASFELVTEIAGGGEASVALQVRGVLVDGTRLDLRARQTSYASSDLAVCGFGAEPGRIFAGAEGACVVTVNNNGFTAIASGTVRSFNPEALASVLLPGHGNSVVVDGDLAFVASGDAGLVVVDVSDRRAPRVLGATDTPGIATDVRLREGLAFVADGPGGLRIFDLADPRQPVEIGSASLEGEAADVALGPGLALVSAGTARRAVVFDVADPRAPRAIAELDTPGQTHGVAYDAGRRLAVVADGATGLHLFDLADPAAPRFTGSLDPGGRPHDVLLAGTTAYIADPTAGVAAVDLSDPARPRLIERASTAGGTNRDLDRFGELLVGADILVRTSAPLLSIAEDGAAVPRARLDLSAFGRRRGTGIAVDANHLYMTASTLFDDQASSGESQLHVGRYRLLTDDAGQAPGVVLLAPATAVPGTFLAEVEAEDDVQLVDVELFVDGRPAGLVLRPPFRFEVEVPVDATRLELAAVASDLGGNRGRAGATVVVLADPAPVVALSAPAEGQAVIAGSTLEIVAEASDNRNVAEVVLRVGGVQIGRFTSPPYRAITTVPMGVESLEITAEARDDLGQLSIAERTVTVIPDPLTTATGRAVLADGTPAAGAQVSCLGESTTSDGGGVFFVGNLPTILGDLTCSVIQADPSGGSLSGASEARAPVPGGLTEMGEILLVQARFIEDLGEPLGLGDDTWASVELPFTFPLFDFEVFDLSINANGNLTFGSVGSFDWTEDRLELVTGQRDIDGRRVGPTVAAFWDDLEPAALQTDLDLYLFSATAGTSIVAEVVAERQGSLLDAAIVLVDVGTGELLAESNDAILLDPRITTTLDTDGPFLLAVAAAFAEQGGEEYFYTLSVDDGVAPRRDVGLESEPNDDVAQAGLLELGDAVHGTIHPPVLGEGPDAFLNLERPGEVVVTWNAVPEVPAIGANTIQVVLFASGKIQIGYRGISSDDAIVGISPGGGDALLEVDFSLDAPLSAPGPAAIFEEFDGPVGPDASGEDPPGMDPFDLDGAFLIFRPRADGGYDLQHVPAPAELGATAQHEVSGVAAVIDVLRALQRSRAKHKEEVDGAQLQK